MMKKKRNEWVVKLRTEAMELLEKLYQSFNSPTLLGNSLKQNNYSGNVWGPSNLQAYKVLSKYNRDIRDDEKMNDRPESKEVNS